MIREGNTNTKKNKDFVINNSKDKWKNSSSITSQLAEKIKATVEEELEESTITKSTLIIIIQIEI